MKATPRTDRGWATVSRIRNAACALFAQQGIRATTLDQVGTLAGAGRSQLYHFYTGKSDLVADVVVLQVERVLEAQQPLLGELATAAQLREWCALAVELHRSSEDPVRCPIGTLVYELSEDEPSARAALAAGLTQWHDALTDGLTRIKARGELASAADPRRTAAGLLAAYQGGLVLAHALADLNILEDALAAVAEPALHPPNARPAEVTASLMHTRPRWDTVAGRTRAHGSEPD